MSEVEYVGGNTSKVYSDTEYIGKFEYRNHEPVLEEVNNNLSLEKIREALNSVEKDLPGNPDLTGQVEEVFSSE
jgi:hypothetical protein